MTMAAPVTPPPRRSFGRRTNLVLFIGMVVGLALVLGAIATNSDIMLLGLPLVLVCAGALFTALALGAVPKMAGTKEKAYLAEMKSDLRNLVTAEEAYFADSTRFTTNLGSMYSASSGVTGPTIATTADGWTAHVGQTSTVYTCAIFVGSTPLAPATAEGAPACDNIRPPFAGRVLLVVGLAIALGAGAALARVTPTAP